MTPIEKAKEALIQSRMHISYDEWPTVCDLIDESISTLEAEKPVDDDLCDIIERLSVCQSRWSDDWKEETAYSIKKYAESYHAKKCAECLSTK